MKKENYLAIIDDDYDDFIFISESFQKFYSIPVHHFAKGSSFFDSVDYSTIDNLCLIVVDLNLPEVGGVEIVAKIKENPFLKDIPVLVLTTSGTPNEVQTCKKLGIEVFKKPSSMIEWDAMVLTMSTFFDPSLVRA